MGETPRTLAPGTVLGGRYEIQEILGKGGMGMVYRAHDRALDETVAVKVLRPPEEDVALAEKRFRSEIKLARLVRHRNVCGIHEYGLDGSLQYIAMEFVPGVDLRHAIRARGGLDREQAFDVAIQAARGLQAIHAQGIVHRDLKTANMMLGADGELRLMDFGIAKRFEGGVTAATATGLVVGTPEYMSPEQVRGEPLDARSDLYALGIVIFELFTGDTPFRGETPVATIFKQVQEAPPLDGPRAARIPPTVVPVLGRLLAKDRAARFASAAEVISALEAARVGSQPTLEQAVAAAPRRPGRRRAVVALGAALALVAAGVYISTRPAPAPSTPPPRLPSVAPTVAPAAAVQGPAASLATARPGPSPRPAAPSTPVPVPVAAAPAPTLPAVPDRVGFVQDGTSFQPPPAAPPGLGPAPSGVVIHAAQPPMPRAQLVIEPTPAQVGVDEPFVLRYSVFNRSSAPLPIRSVAIRNVLPGGAVTGGPVEPLAGTATPRTRTLLLETRATWTWDTSSDWSSAITLELEDGSVYVSTLRTRR